MTPLADKGVIFSLIVYIDNHTNPTGIENPESKKSISDCV